MRAGRIDLAGYMQRHLLPVGAGCLILVVAIGGVAFVPPSFGVNDVGALQQQSKHHGAVNNALASANAFVDNGGVPPTPIYEPLLIGDSVSVRIIPVFEDTFPNGYIDSQVGRYMASATDIYDYYKNKGEVGNTVIISLATNGPIDDGQVDDLMKDIGNEKAVYFINTRSPNDWTDTNNDVLARAATRYANAYVIDWYSKSTNEDLFDGDGTHLTAEAAVYYTQMICDALGYTEKTPSIDSIYNS